MPFLEFQRVRIRTLTGEVGEYDRFGDNERAPHVGDVGTVVAALSGLVRISPPWRELIAFYRNLNTVHVKYKLLIAAFPNERSDQL